MDEIEEPKVKCKSLFDHLNQIREEKNPEYYMLLTEQEKKSFNQYMILMGLSMDSNCIEEISVISKYLELIPNNQFYKVCCDIIPRGRKFSKWIKRTKGIVDIEILRKISQYYEVSISIAREYYEVLAGVDGISKILSKYGLTEKEIKTLLK
jgi:hypothetical protein